MRGDDLPGRPIFRNTNEANSKILNEKQDPSLTEAGGGDGTQPHECQPNSRQHSLSVRSHTSAEISMQRGNSSIQIATAVSRNEDGTLLKNTAINTGEAFEDYNTSTMVVSEADKDTHIQQGGEQQSSCINGVLRSKFESLGSSFGSLLGIQTPVKMIDKTPDEDIWELDEESSSNFRALATHYETRKYSISSRANDNGSLRSAKTGQTPTNDSFALSDGTIPFLPELTWDNREDEKTLQPKLPYRSSTICAHNTEVNSSTLMPPREPLHAHDHESITSDVEELARNGFTIAQTKPSSIEDVKDLLKKASQSESEGDYKLALDFHGMCLDFYSRMKKSSNFQPTSKHHANVASLFHNVGVVHWKIGAYDESLRALRKARRQIYQAIELCEGDEVQPTKELLCDILNTIGRIFASKGDFDEALEQHSESLSILKSLFVDNKKKSSADLSMDKKIRPEDQTKIPDIDSQKGHILNNRDESGGMNHPGIARALICMGTVHVSSGKLPVAMELFKGGLEIQRKIVGSKHVDVAATLNSIGSVYEKTGRHEKAMQCYKKARQIYIKNLGDDHVDVASTLNNIGQVYHHLSEHQKAMDSFRSALWIMKRVLGKSHRNVAAIYYNMGLVHVQCCQYETAMKVFKETLILQREALGDDHVDVALTLESIGGIYEQRLRIDRALELYYKALSIRQRATRDHLFVAFSMDRIGKCQMNLNGDVTEAILCFNEALVLYRANGITENNPLVWEAKQNLAAAAKVLKQRQKESEDALIGLDITIS
jgi:tetratricopeptide (TPR) repeat protein